MKLTPYWQHSQVSYMWSSFHVRQDMELIGAARNVDFLHWTGIPCVNVEPKDENVGLKGGLPNYDELAYRVLLSKAKTDAAKVRFRVDNYTKDHVTIFDKDVHSAKLDQIDEYHLAFQDWITCSMSTFDENIPSMKEKLMELRKISYELNLYVQTNKIEVKRKVVDLLQEYERNVPISPAEMEKFDLERKILDWKKMVDRKMADEKKRLADQEKIKVLKKLGQISSEMKKLSSRISRLKEVDDMTEDEIVEALQKSRQWELDVQGVKIKLDSVDVDSVGVDIDQKALDDVHEEFQLVSKSVAEKIDALEKRDKILCLYTLAPLKRKEDVHYPKPFSGMDAENVYEFIADIQQAMNDDQIRTRNKVKVLMNYLKGDAKIAVKHAMNVDIWYTINDLEQEKVGNTEFFWQE